MWLPCSCTYSCQTSPAVYLRHCQQLHRCRLHTSLPDVIHCCTNINCTRFYLRQSQQLHRCKSRMTLPEAISTAARLHLRGTAEVRLWSCLIACCRCTCVARAACPMRDTAPRAMRGPSLPCIPSAKTRRRNSSEPALFAESAMPAITDMAANMQVYSCS